MGLWLNPLGLDRVASGRTRIHTFYSITLYFFLHVFPWILSRIPYGMPTFRWFIATHAEHSTTPPSRADGDSSGDSCGHVGTKLSLRYSRLARGACGGRMARVDGCLRAWIVEMAAKQSGMMTGGILW